MLCTINFIIFELYNYHSIVALHVGNLLLQFLHLFFLEHALVLDRHYLDEVFNVAVPVVEHGTGEFAARVEIVLADELVKLLAVGVFFHEIDFHHVHVAEIVEVVVLVPDVGHAARHTSGEVASRLAKHYHASTRHIFTAVVAGTLDDGNGSRVAHTETFTHLAVDVEFARGGTIETGVTGDDVVLGMEILTTSGWRQNRDATA